VTAARQHRLVILLAFGETGIIPVDYAAARVGFKAKPATAA